MQSQGDDDGDNDVTKNGINSNSITNDNNVSGDSTGIIMTVRTTTTTPTIIILIIIMMIIKTIITIMVMWLL